MMMMMMMMMTMLMMMSQDIYLNNLTNTNGNFCFHSNCVGSERISHTTQEVCRLLNSCRAKLGFSQWSQSMTWTSDSLWMLLLLLTRTFFD
jgi:hypothetical protein